MWISVWLIVTIMSHQRLYAGVSVDNVTCLVGRDTGVWPETLAGEYLFWAIHLSINRPLVGRRSCKGRGVWVWADMSLHVPSFISSCLLLVCLASADELWACSSFPSILCSALTVSCSIILFAPLPTSVQQHHSPVMCTHYFWSVLHPWLAQVGIQRCVNVCRCMHVHVYTSQVC